MNDYIIVRTEGLYKIYRKLQDSQDVYQYAGATFVMLPDAQAFVDLKNGVEPDAA